MKDEIKKDEEIVAREGNITIDMRELKTSLPKLVEEYRTHLSAYDLLMKMMLLTEVRFEIIQHTLKPILNDSIDVLSNSKKIMKETNELLDEIREQLKTLKENE